MNEEHETELEPVVAEEPAPAHRKAAELWAAEKKTPDWLLAGARAHAFGHAIGREVTEAEFDAACADVLSLPIR